MARIVRNRVQTTPQPIDWLLSPFQRFLRIEAAGGIILLACTAAALLWANSRWGDVYHDLWHTYVTLSFGDRQLKLSLAHWVNDGLMAVFFFVVGLEIKREILVGELASFRRASVPIAAAIGGMAAPALIFAAMNRGTEAIDGWAIPTATDIAFAIGVMALLGSRVPIGLKVFLTAVAIVDDIGAVLIIAIFYTSGIETDALWTAAGIVVVLVLANLAGVRHPVVYALLGLALWGAFLASGVHATVAGVVLALTVPSRFRIETGTFSGHVRRTIDEFDRCGESADDILSNARRQAAVESIEESCEKVLTPLTRMEHRLLPFVAYLIMPVFALANAGVALGEGASAALTGRLGLGIGLGLVLGKPVGVTLGALAAVALGLGTLPARVGWRQVVGAGLLAGIGFTMSLFIANLGFGEGSEALMDAKIGILAGSAVSGVAGFIVLRLGAAPPPPPSGGAEQAD